MIAIRRIFIGSFFFFVFQIIGYGQNYALKQYSVKEGLASSLVYCAKQDLKGFLWIGTDNGLCRFDGKQFVTYTATDGLPDNEVLEIWIDSKGRVWLSCFNSPICFIENGIIYTSKNTKWLENAPVVTSYYEFFEDSKNTIWISGDESLIRISENKLMDVRFANFSGRSYIKFYEQNGQIYIAEFSDLYQWKGNSFQLLESNDYRFILAKYRKYCRIGADMYLYNRSNIIARVNDADITNLDIKDSISFSQKVNFIIPDAASKLIFVGTDNGVVITDSTLFPLNSSLLEGMVISSIFIDFFGNTWFCTFGNGIFMLPEQRFIKARLPSKNNEDVINTICKTDAGYLMAGAESGKLYRINNVDDVRGIDISGSRYGDKRISIIKPFKDNLFIGTSTAMIDYNMTNKTSTFYKEPGSVKTIAVSKNGYVFRGESNKSLLYPPKILEPDILLYKRSIASCFDNNDKLWFATVDKLLTYNWEKIDTIQWYEVGKYGRISSLDHLSDNTIIASTYNSGVLIGKKDAMISLNKKSGLSGDLCRQVFVDDMERIWVCTNSGLNLVYFNKEKAQVDSIKVFDESSGLLSNSVYAVHTTGDSIWVGTDRGIGLFVLSKSKQEFGIPTHIVSLSNGVKSYTHPDSIPTFSYDENEITITYTGISFIGNAELQYAYRLSGNKMDWNFTRQQAVVLSNLNPGKYVFEVYAFNPKNNTRFIKSSIAFEITPAYWQTTIFRVTGIIIIAGFLSMIIILYIRRLKQIQQKKLLHDSELYGLRLEALRSQFNPHFVFNALNSAQTYNIRNNDQEAQSYLSKLARLLRSNLTFAKQDFVTLSEEMNYITQYLELEQMRYKDKLIFTVTANSDLATNDIILPSQIIQPYVENAVQHGIKPLNDGEGLINVTFTLQNELLICSIEDNGVGIMYSIKNKKQEDHAYKSIGMQLASGRIEITNKLYKLNIRITVIDRSTINKNTSGTLVTIFFPLLIKHDNENINN